MQRYLSYLLPLITLFSGEFMCAQTAKNHVYSNEWIHKANTINRATKKRNVLSICDSLVSYDQKEYYFYNELGKLTQLDMMFSSSPGEFQIENRLKWNYFSDRIEMEIYTGSNLLTALNVYYLNTEGFITACHIYSQLSFEPFNRVLEFIERYTYTSDGLVNQKITEFYSGDSTQPANTLKSTYSYTAAKNLDRDYLFSLDTNHNEYIFLNKNEYEYSLNKLVKVTHFSVDSTQFNYIDSYSYELNKERFQRIFYPDLISASRYKTIENPSMDLEHITERSYQFATNGLDSTGSEGLQLYIDMSVQPANVIYPNDDRSMGSALFNRHTKKLSTYLQEQFVDNSWTTTKEFIFYYSEKKVELTPINAHELVIFPNPVADVLYIESENLKEGKYIITDVNGSLVLEATFQSSTESIDLSELNSGCYFLDVLTKENHKVTKKIVKL